MKTRHCIFFLLIVITITAKAQKQHYTQAVEDRIRNVENGLGGWVKIQDSTGWNILSRMAYYRINGLSIAIIHNYKVEWVKAYGWADTAQKIPATANTLFQPASIGKSLNAVGVMKLVQDGELDLKEDINSYLKQWKFPYDSVSHEKKINTLELLSHTAGLSVHGFDGYKWGQPIPNILQILNGEAPANSPAVRSIFEPGVKFEYSGGGIEISGLMVEDITGLRYANYMRKTIFKPLGMNHTFYYSQLIDKEKGLATAYRFDGRPIGCKYYIYPEEACGAGLWSTPGDMAKFIIELQLSLKNKSNKILSAATIKQMFTPQVDKNVALGFFIEEKGGQTYFHHTGLNEGFISNYYASVKDGDGVVIMANSDYLTGEKDITEEIANSVAMVYGWKGFYTPAIKKEIIVSESILKTYCGKYKFNGTPEPTVTVFWKDSKLWFRDSGSPLPWLMHFTNNTDFFFHEVTFNTHSFTKGADGNVDGFTIKTHDGNFNAKKIHN